MIYKVNYKRNRGGYIDRGHWKLMETLMEKGYYFILVIINITKHITTPNELQKQNKNI